jgi:hypothetical protein
MTIEKQKKKKVKDYIPYSVWMKDVIEKIDQLTDECLDRFYDNRKTNEEILKILSKLKRLVEDKYKK